jgi:hypothetical protein
MDVLGASRHDGGRGPVEAAVDELIDELLRACLRAECPGPPLRLVRPVGSTARVEQDCDRLGEALAVATGHEDPAEAVLGDVTGPPPAASW